LKVLALALVLAGLGCSNAAQAAGNASKEKHIDAFSRLLVQDHQGPVWVISTGYAGRVQNRFGNR
ncbi:MAG TPA: hypothetical protein PLM60_05385, partial [Methanoregulaceae archaeon]|nr:hypothetical protein [Methanoregulaceae archaeon]